jgi:KaiC/GvpD/RAD55 family RecA-like ATPase
MHLKELTHRSPLRILERSVHGGLGKGNIGVILARSGVGKTAFMTCLALDDLLRDRKVLSVACSATVDHVREYYDEMFADLAKSTNLEEAVIARDKIEHNRFIRSLNGRGLHVEQFESSLQMLARDVGFRPDVVHVDGFQFDEASADDVRRLRDVAREHGVEMWMTQRLKAEEEQPDWKELPGSVARFGDLVSVCLLLQPEGSAIRIRLIKDGASAELADLALDLDPKTYLVREG